MLSREQLKQTIDEYGNKISLGAFVNNDEVEQINTAVRRTAASLIKPFIFYYVVKNRKAFDNLVSPEDIPLTQDTILRFFRGSKLTLNGLLSLMIDISDNSISNYFLDKIGIGAINNFLAAEGFAGTSFGRRFLDSEARKSGHENYTTVSDLRKLYSGILDGQFLVPEERKLFIDIMRTQFDRSKFAFYLPETIETGGKSGVLDNVWNDLIFFKRNEKTVLLIALTEDMPSTLGRDFLSSYSYHFVKERFPEALRGIS